MLYTPARRALAWMIAAAAAFSSPSANAFTVREALAVNLNRWDMEPLASGIKDVIFGVSTVSGTFEIPFGTPATQGVSVDRIRYQFDVPTFRVTPEYGALKLYAEVSHLSAFVDHVYIDPSRTRYCRGLRATSLSGSIPISLKVVPRLDGTGRLKLELRDVDVGINRSNLYFHSVIECNVLGPIDGIIARMVPGVANTMQGEMAKMITAKVYEMAPVINAQVEKWLAAEIIVPLTKPPFPRKAVVASVFPATIEITDQGLRAVFGVNAYIAGKGPERDDEVDERPWSRGVDRRTYIGIAPAFVDRLLAEAAAKNVFVGEIGADNQPGMEILFKAQTVQTMVPDAQARFQGDEPMSLRLLGATRLGFQVDDAEATAVRFRLNMERFGLGFSIRRVPYYDFHMSGSLPLGVAFDPKTAKATIFLRIPEGLRLDDAAFAPGLDPAPASDSGMTETVLQDTVAALAEMFTEENGGLVSLRLPNVRFGNTIVIYRGFEDDPQFLRFNVEMRRF